MWGSLSVFEAISHFTRLECLRITHASRVSMVGPTRTRRHEADQDQAPSVKFRSPAHDVQQASKFKEEKKKDLPASTNAVLRHGIE